MRPLLCIFVDITLRARAFLSTAIKFSHEVGYNDYLLILMRESDFILQHGYCINTGLFSRYIDIYQPNTITGTKQVIF